MISCKPIQSNSDLKFNSSQVNLSDSQNWVKVLNAIPMKDSLLAIKPINFYRSLTFLDLDPGTERVKYIHNIPFNYYIQNEWITEADVDTLISFIYEKRIAQTPLHRESSCLYEYNSTNGIEAIRLIQIFKDSTFRYPSCLGININTPEKQDQLGSEIENWWKKYKSD